ncbi:hypothetical protein BD408DRAFT_421796 [Parasitella parasitica]|nr:hypothetical protein BD408DRAFT_421796 [Parasitella parasitica]
MLCTHISCKYIFLPVIVPCFTSSHSIHLLVGYYDQIVIRGLTCFAIKKIPKSASK